MDMDSLLGTFAGTTLNYKTESEWPSKKLFQDQKNLSVPDQKNFLGINKTFSGSQKNIIVAKC